MKPHRQYLAYVTIRFGAPVTCERSVSIDFLLLTTLVVLVEQSVRRVCPDNNFYMKWPLTWTGNRASLARWFVIKVRK